MTTQIVFTAGFIIYLIAIIYLLVATFRELFKYITSHKNIKKSVLGPSGILILVFLWVIIPQIIDLFNTITNKRLSIGPAGLNSEPCSAVLAQSIFVLFFVLVFHGLVYFSIRLSEYFKHGKIEVKQSKRFSFVEAILLTIFTLVVFWCSSPVFNHFFKDLIYGGLPSPTSLYYSLGNFLCKYWFIGVIPIIGLILFETKIKLNKELKTLIYQFISYSCVLNMLLMGVSFCIPIIPFFRTL